MDFLGPVTFFDEVILRLGGNQLSIAVFHSERKETTVSHQLAAVGLQEGVTGRSLWTLLSPAPEILKGNMRRSKVVISREDGLVQTILKWPFNNSQVKQRV
jgi:hypothetical protein